MRYTGRRNELLNTCARMCVCAKSQDFQKHLPLITALRNPGLRGRHWERISSVVGAPIKGDAGFNLSRALQLGLPSFVSSIEEISEYASKVCWISQLANG